MVLMERRCVHCDREMPVDATFCPYCGTQQAPSEPEKEERRPEPILHQVSESLVWDSNIIEAARRLTGRSPLAVDSHEFGPADLRNLAHVSRFLEDHSMAAAASGPNVTPVVLAPRTMLVENYVIEDTLGMGGMGMVYQARDMAMHRRVAVKVLHANLFRKERSRQRFMREAKLMAALYHPNILRIHDLLEQEEWMAIVMQLVQGKSLREYLEANTGPLSLTVIRDLFDPILSAMSHAHREGVVHRDIKPGNILLQEGERGVTPLVADFGLAKVLEGTNYTVSGTLLGTCLYMAPEQFQNHKKVEPKSDVYALGVLLYQMCVGHPPFQQRDLFSLMSAHLEQAPTPPSSLRADLPEAWNQLILDALEKSPERRVSSCDEFRDRLLAASLP